MWRVCGDEHVDDLPARHRAPPRSSRSGYDRLKRGYQGSEHDQIRWEPVPDKRGARDDESSSHPPTLHEYAAGVDATQPSR
jgi:hypothetical protein